MKSRRKNVEKDTLLKVRFYLMSLCLLFGLIFLLTVDVPVSFSPNARFIGWIPLLQRNILAFPSLLMAVFSMCIAYSIQYEWSGVSNPTYKVTSARNENFEYLTFLTTYIIPLICIDLENMRYVLVLAILLVLIGFIFVKMDLYYGNPTLALMGYRLYRVEIEGVDAPDGVILISKDHITKGKSIKWIPIDKYVWVAKEAK